MYYKNCDNSYIKSVSTGAGKKEISNAEYNEILEVIRNKPTPPQGYDYRLKEDLTWELYELSVPEPEDEEATEQDYIGVLERLGVK